MAQISVLDVTFNPKSQCRQFLFSSGDVYAIWVLTAWLSAGRTGSFGFAFEKMESSKTK